MSDNSRKNIVLLIPQMRHGGAERVVSRLSFLLNKDYNIKIVVFDDSVVTYETGCKIDSLNIPSIKENKIFTKFLNVFKRLYLYTKYKRKNNIDITYSFGDTANIINILSLGKDKKIISIRGFKRIRVGKNFIEKFIMRPISIFLCKRADKIVSVSNLISSTLAKEYNISSAKIFTSHNGYDIQSIRTLAKESLTSEETQIFNNNKVIITAGTFRGEKGYWHLLKAFSEVKENTKNVKLVILGEDYKNNKIKIQKLADDLKLSDSIIMLGYKLNPYKYFSKSTVYVLSSTFEGFPNAMVEAMSCGLPVVASDCQSGPREIIAPNTNIFRSTESIEIGEHGVLVNKMNLIENYSPDDIEICDKYLATAIIKFLNDEEFCKKYSDRSYERANFFGYDSWLEKQKEILSFQE